MNQRYSIDAFFTANRPMITIAASTILRAHIIGDDIDPINTTQQLLVEEMNLDPDMIPVHTRHASTAAGNVATLLWDTENASVARRVAGNIALVTARIEPYSAGALRSGIPQQIVYAVGQSKINF